MCYSAMVWEDYNKYRRAFGAKISFEVFLRLYVDRNGKTRITIPKGMDAGFANPKTDEERQIKALIDEFNVEQRSKLEQEIFAQKKRLADAERNLQTKTTKKDTESKRIATDKISKAITKLSDRSRTEPKDRDSRIFPGVYAPVMIVENGKRMVVPMRYQCRLAGKPAKYDFEYPGTYNARRDNLERFWKQQFGYSHGIMVVNAFYENVSRHAMEHRELAPGEKEENVVLEFTPHRRRICW
jgi:hypothetical protein